MRRRRSRTEGKNDPWRSLGIRSSRSPALVESSRDLPRLRWFLRSAERSVGRGADHLGRLGFDEDLEDELHPSAHHVEGSPPARIASRRSLTSNWDWATVCLLHVHFGRYTLRITRWPTSWVDPDGSDTTRGDANHVTAREDMMKAIVYDRYGSPDVLELMEINEPVVGDDQVLVRVRAASLNPTDWHSMRGLPYIVRMINGLRKPRKVTVLGGDLAGQVAAVGESVTQVRPGDEVFGRTRAGHRPDPRVEVATGACAEYACVSDDLLAPKPANLTFEQAAAVPLAALTALQALRDKGNVQPGQNVLINGASGGVGTFAVQIAKSLGAEVTGVCSQRNVDMVRSIGAEHVIDYTQEDFSTTGRRYDLILDTADRSLSDCRRALTPKGTLVVIGGSPGRWINGLGRSFKARVLSPFVSQRLFPFLTRWSKQDLRVVKDLIEAGNVTPVIDRTYPLSEAPEAMRHLEGGHARGKVVITV